MTITLVGKFYELNEIKFKSPDKGERTVYQIVITHDSHPTYGEKRVCFSVKPEMVKTINDMAQAGMTMAFDCDLNAKDYTDASGNKRCLLTFGLLDAIHISRCNNRCISSHKCSMQ